MARAVEALAAAVALGGSACCSLQVVLGGAAAAEPPAERTTQKAFLQLRLLDVTDPALPPSLDGEKPYIHSCVCKASITFHCIVTNHQSTMPASGDQHYCGGRTGSATVFKPPLSQQRYRCVAQLLRRAGATTVLDLGCGDGKFLEHLLLDRHHGQNPPACPGSGQSGGGSPADLEMADHQPEHRNGSEIADVAPVGEALPRTAVESGATYGAGWQRLFGLDISESAVDRGNRRLQVPTATCPTAPQSCIPECNCRVNHGLILLKGALCCRAQHCRSCLLASALPFSCSCRTSAAQSQACYLYSQLAQDTGGQQATNLRACSKHGVKMSSVCCVMSC